jgi:hypothetical protein
MLVACLSLLARIAFPFCFVHMNGAARTKKLPAEKCEQAKNFSFSGRKKYFFFPSFSFLLSLPSSPSRARASQPLLKPSARSCHPHPPLCCLSLSQTHRGEEEKAVEHSPASPASRKIYLYTRRRGRKSFSRFSIFGKKNQKQNEKSHTRSERTQNINNGAHCESKEEILMLLHASELRIVINESLERPGCEFPLRCVGGGGERGRTGAMTVETKGW